MTNYHPFAVHEHVVIDLLYCSVPAPSLSPFFLPPSHHSHTTLAIPSGADDGLALYRLPAKPVTTVHLKKTESPGFSATVATDHSDVPCLWAQSDHA